MLREQVLRAFRLLPAGRRALRLVWEATGAWSILWASLLLTQSLLPAGQALLLRALVNRLAGAAEGPRVLAPALGIGALWLLAMALASALSWVRTLQAERVQDEVHRRIHTQALRLDVAFFDRPDSYDALHRARVDALSQPLALLEGLGTAVQSGLGFLALAAILWTYAGWLPLLLIGTALPGLLLVTRHILREHAWRQRNTPAERKVRYLDWMITERDAACELRLFSLGTYHRELFATIRARLRREGMQVAAEGGRAELLAGLLAWAGSLAGLGWMLGRTLSRTAGLGDLLLCFQAFQQGQTLLRAVLDSSGRIFRSLLFVENLDAFLALEPELRPASATPAVPPFPLAQGIRFEAVSFTYAGSDHPALDQFNLDLPANQVVALVGSNGAGKSTLIKLLCRFYDPDQGRILMDGLDLRDLDPDALRRHITVLFQAPVHYHATARENIAYGDLQGLEDLPRIQAAAEAAGALAPILRLQGGFQAVLGKWFGGAELSGGEWQRLALARAFFRQSGLIILDEPTSAMDSWAEQDWLARFRTLTEGRTALMITHRFTTAMHADRIHVLEQGRVVESGTHADLVAAGGRYAQSWSEQMRDLRG